MGGNRSELGPPQPRLADWAGRRDNNLDLLRLIGALLVIYAHAFPIARLPDRKPPFYQGHYGTLGVAIFLVISGFLITQSYLRSPSPLRFAWARILRIYPALMAVTLLLTFVAGPLLSTLSAPEYFAHPWTWSYPRGALSLYEVTRFTVLPGVFMANPIVQTNGPLWTLQYEWTFYFVVVALGVAGRLERPGAMTALLLAAVGLTHFGVGAGRTWYWTPVEWVFVYFSYFGIGAVAYLHRARIPMSGWLVGVAVAVMAAGAFRGGLADSAFVAPLAYCVLFVGLHPRLTLSALTRTGDYSYGLYLWGWPAAQSVYQLTGPETSVWRQLAASVCIAYGLAVASWHLIEKRALSLKLRPPTPVGAITPPQARGEEPGRRAIAGLATASLLVGVGLVIMRPAPDAEAHPTATARAGDGAWHQLPYQSSDAATEPRFDDTFARANGYRVFAQNGEALFGTFTTAGAAVTARVEAAGSAGGGRVAQLVVEIRRADSHVPVLRRILALTEHPAAHDVPMPEAGDAGPYEVRLVFEDDFYADGQGDRNAVIYGVSVK